MIEQKNSSALSVFIIEFAFQVLTGLKPVLYIYLKTQ